MSKNTLLGIALVIIVILAGYFFFARKASAPTPPVDTVATTTATTPTGGSQASPSGSTGSAALPPNDITHTLDVGYTDAGFSPKTIIVRVGDTVRFVNNSSHGMWVASAVHPTHAAYDGTSVSQHCANGNAIGTPFDECTSVNPGTTYSYTFEKVGTFPYHNHVRAADTGSVQVL